MSAPLVQLAGALLSGGLLQALARPAWRLLRGSSIRDAESIAVEGRRSESETERLSGRVADLEDLIGLLRKALDKHLIRESAVVTLAELLVNMIDQLLDHLADPPPALLRTYERALELLKMARAQLDKINSGEPA